MADFFSTGLDDAVWRVGDFVPHRIRQCRRKFRDLGPAFSAMRVIAGMPIGLPYAARRILPT